MCLWLSETSEDFLAPLCRCRRGVCDQGGLLVPLRDEGGLLVPLACAREGFWCLWLAFVRETREDFWRLCVVGDQGGLFGAFA